MIFDLENGNFISFISFKGPFLKLDWPLLVNYGSAAVDFFFLNDYNELEGGYFTSNNNNERFINIKINYIDFTVFEKFLSLLVNWVTDCQN